MPLFVSPWCYSWVPFISSVGDTRTPFIGGINAAKTRALQTAKQVFLDAGLGGLVFWVPDVVLHIVRGHRFSGADVITLTILLPVIAITSLSLIGFRWRCARAGSASTAVSALIGIWLFGPIFMMAGMIHSGEGFASPIVWIMDLRFWLEFPFILTFIMSTYDGSLGGLTIITFIMGVKAVRAWRHSRGIRSRG